MPEICGKTFSAYFETCGKGFSAHFGSFFPNFMHIWGRVLFFPYGILTLSFPQKFGNCHFPIGKWNNMNPFPNRKIDFLGKIDIFALYFRALFISIHNLLPFFESLIAFHYLQKMPFRGFPFLVWCVYYVPKFCHLTLSLLHTFISWLLTASEDGWLDVY